MSSGEPELLSTGPDRDRPPPWRRALDRSGVGGLGAVATLVVAALVVAAAVGGVLVGRATASEPAAAAAPTASGSAVVVPEVVVARTLPDGGGVLVRPVVPGPDGATYDYDLTGAPWLAPDGTIRTGPPGCTRPTDRPQLLQVAVVHARPVEGGPAQDRVVWYRCLNSPFNP
jgi:hypothetical protein